MVPPSRAWIRWLLASPALLFHGAVSLRNGLYRRQVLRPVRAGVPVVSVGNLTVGGSGKTPFVAYLASRMRESGRRVAVALRGYGGRRQGAPFVVSHGTGPLASVEEVGDEAVLLATHLPSVVVVACADRAAAACFARERYGSDVILLDDGFQHRRLHRDLDLLLIDAGAGLGNGRMLPFGPLREPVEEVRRAHALIVTGLAEDLPDDASRLEGLPASVGVSVPVFRCERRHDGFLGADLDELVSPTALKGMRAFAFSGIARPEAFESDLRRLGLELVSSLRFRDHQRFRPAQLEEIRAAAREAKADLLVTTEKDRVRLGSAPFSAPLYALRMRLVPQDEAGLWSFISERLFDRPSASRRASG